MSPISMAQVQINRKAFFQRAGSWSSRRSTSAS
jgi:hypothetical protein